MFKTYLPLLVGFILISPFSFSQVTPVFQFSDFAYEAYEMPKQFNRVTLNGVLAFPGEGPEQVWDFTEYSVSDNQVKPFYASRDTFFAQANIVEPGYNDYIKGTFIPYELYMHFGQNGNQIIGRHYPRFAFDLSFVSGNAGDSLIIPDQAALSVPGNFTLRFPQSFPGIYTETSDISVFGSISFALAGYTNTPFVKKTKEIRNEEISGRGQCIVPVNGGNAAYSCILQKTKITSIDSFFVNGQAAPDMLLTAFGLSQGLTFDRSESNLYKRGAYLPLVTYKHSNANFGPVDAIYMQYDVLGYAQINETNFSDEITVFPNPLRGNTLYVQTEQTILETDIVDISGRKVFSTRNADNEIRIPSEVANGIYILRIQTAEGEKKTARWVLNR